MFHMGTNEILLHLDHDTEEPSENATKMKEVQTVCHPPSLSVCLSGAVTYCPIRLQLLS